MEHTNKNCRNGVRKYIENNSQHIKHFYKKETQFDNVNHRINTIIKLYTKSETKSTKNDCNIISKDFENFKIWHKTLTNICI